MAGNKLIAIVTVLILVGSTGNAQDNVTIDELRAIESLIDGKDWRGLYSYVQANPKLTAGNDPLAVELRTFVDDAKRGALTTFNAAPGQTAPRSVPDPVIY
ncbi:hypothetical protein KX928_14095 [Roseobacter sp. YSTF-M11]|uniref:Uncharacterized protein n=1 Tax=Roseobacter insulae TaxID=2859783 RepID=A0A9X1JZ30_9RHOB|nr:hypothetical protein [Roseobacter insulae]MBW4708916.1 hypothetical protein [Roseobacter insulae]